MNGLVGHVGSKGVRVDAGVEGEKGAKGGRNLSVIVFYISIYLIPVS